MFRKTDVKTSHAYEEHLYLRNREGEAMGYPTSTVSLILNKHLSRDQPDETNLKKLVCACVCVTQTVCSLIFLTCRPNLSVFC